MRDVQKLQHYVKEMKQKQDKELTEKKEPTDKHVSLLNQVEIFPVHKLRDF